MHVSLELLSRPRDGDVYHEAGRLMLAYERVEGDGPLIRTVSPGLKRDTAVREALRTQIPAVEATRDVPNDRTDPVASCNVINLSTLHENYVVECRSV